MAYRILYFITGLNTGGAEVQLYRLVTRLDPSCYDVIVVSLIKPGSVGEMLREAGIPVYSLGMARGIFHLSSYLHGAWRLYRILRQEQPCILVSFMFHANILGRIVGRLAEVPIIISSIRNSYFGGRGCELLMRCTSWLDNIVVINSQLAGEQVVQRGVVPRHKLRVIPNGIDVKDFHQPPEVCGVTRSSLKLPNNSFLWLAIGRLEPQKNYSDLLRAFVKVVEHKMQTHLLIAGDGPLKEELWTLATSLGIEAHVHFLGFRQDIPDLLAAADALVLSSRWEGLPNVVMEAMAAEKPVVATKVGGTPELVANGKTGFTVPARDSRILAEAMRRLMNLPEEVRKEMGLAGRGLMKEHYSIERIVQQWEALYNELLERRSLI